MAASIPILRHLLRRRESQPKPAEFIQLAGNCQAKARQSPAPEQVDDQEAKQGDRQSWARIAHLEQARIAVHERSGSGSGLGIGP